MLMGYTLLIILNIVPHHQKKATDPIRKKLIPEVSPRESGLSVMIIHINNFNRISPQENKNGTIFFIYTKAKNLEVSRLKHFNTKTWVCHIFFKKLHLFFKLFYQFTLSEIILNFCVQWENIDVTS